MTCAKGELVTAPQRREDSTDGWLCVSRLGDETQKGYVPVDYLEPVKTQASSADSLPVNSSAPPFTTSSPHAGGSPTGFGGFHATSAVDDNTFKHQSYTSGNILQMETSPSNATNLGPIRRLSDPRLGAHLDESVGRPVQDKIVPSSASPRTMQLPTADMSDDFSNLISLHDDWLKNMQTAHQDAFRGMVNAIDDLGSRVGACQEKNNQIVDQMNLLDALIEEERVKWKQRLDSEKSAMTNRIASMYNSTTDELASNSPQSGGAIENN